MSAIPHALLNTLKANKPAFGAWLTLPGYLHARTVAQSSPHLSWVLIDCEHGTVPLSGRDGVTESILGLSAANLVKPTASNVQPVQKWGPSALVRIPATGASTGVGWQLKYALDAGAQGILVPFISTAEKAREIVLDSRFPPVGRRGFGNPFTQDTWGVSVTDYLKSANDTVVVMIQIENQEGFKNVKEIAEVDGIDVLFIGPYDLSIAFGFPPPSPDPHPEVEKLIQVILKTAHNASKKCAIYCTSGAQAAIRAKEGFDMINVTSDVGAMSNGLAMHLDAATSSN